MMNAAEVEKVGRRYVLPPGAHGTPALGTTIKAWCPVCDGPTVKVYKLVAVDLTHRFAAVCHSSVEYGTFSDVALMCSPYFSDSAPAACVREWLCNVFKADTNPDVMLAIRYGQGKTMKESVK